MISKELIETDRLLSGYLDCDKLLEKVVQLTRETLKFEVAALFVREPGESKIKIHSISSRVPTDKLFRVLGQGHMGIRMPLLPTCNYLTRCFASGATFIDKNLVKFVEPYFSKAVCDTLKVVSFTKSFMVSAIKHGDAVDAVLFIGNSQENFTEKDQDLIEQFCQRISFAMANAAAHERVMERFRRLYLARARRTDEEKADIKFTLRITPKIEKYLSWKTQNTDLTKADYLREMIDKDLTSDEDFKKFIGESDQSK